MTTISPTSSGRLEDEAIRKEALRMDHIPSIGSVMTPFPCVVQVNTVCWRPAPSWSSTRFVISR